jgi:DNA-binding NtrC family response regulator
MPISRFILCEKTTRWASALRAQLAKSRLQLVETRSLPGCAEALAASPASFVAIEITPNNLEPVLDLIRRIAAHYSHAVVAALLSAETLAAAPLFREAGAIDVASSVLQAPRLIRLAQKHYDQAAADPLTARQFVSERLPWPSHATSSSPVR